MGCVLNVHGSGTPPVSFPPEIVTTMNYVRLLDFIGKIPEEPEILLRQIAQHLVIFQAVDSEAQFSHHITVNAAVVTAPSGLIVQCPSDLFRSCLSDAQ